MRVRYNKIKLQQKFKNKTDKNAVIIKKYHDQQNVS